MATHYVTSAADSGEGTLRQTITNAANGDVIRFSEDAFERGEKIEIVLGSSLYLSKSLTFDAGANRVVINGDGSFRCVETAADTTLEFIGFDFVGGNAKSGNGGAIRNNGTMTLTRCSICGCKAKVGGGVVNSNKAVLKIVDSAIYGNLATDATGGLFVNTAANSVEIVRSTIAGNVNGDMKDTANLSTVVDSIIAEDDLAAYNFVAIPASLEEGDWTENDWKAMNFRLLDDGSETPSSYRDAAEGTDEILFDLDGNARGRKQIVDGETVKSRSPGAYETIQADYFWVGKDANGNEIDAPSWNAPDGWATSRFAQASNATSAPAAGLTYFIEGTVDFVDYPTFTVASCGGIIRVGHGATVAIDFSASQSEPIAIGVGESTRLFPLEAQIILQ